MSQRKAALIELYDSHSVNLYTQLLFLQNGDYDTTLICSAHHRDEVAVYQPAEMTMLTYCTGKKGFALWQELRRIRKFLVAGGFEKVIINTAHSSPVRNLCLMPYPNKMRFFGNLHGVNKLEGSFTQKLISRRIRQYFVLNDYMLEKAKKLPPAGLSFAAYYPIFHPPFTEVVIEKKAANACWVAIPGGVEYSRRDYNTLLEALRKMKNVIPADLRFFLLGNSDREDGHHLKKQINDAGLADHFFCYNGFMPDSLLHAYISRCDAVLPLIHPVNAAMVKYLENQISGSYNLAFAYQKPLLMHDYFRRYEDFRDTSFFYNTEDLPQLLSHLPQALQSLNGNIYQLPKWTLSYQQTNYLRFLES